MAVRKYKKKGGNAGRPSKYYPEINDEMIEYFSKDPMIEEEVTKTDKQGNQFTEIKTRAALLPTLTEFAKMKELDLTTLHYWRDNIPEFSRTYKKCKELQANFLMVNGLHNHYHGSFAIFTMKNICGWKDKQEVTHEGKFSLEGALTKTIEDNTKQLPNDEHSDALDADYIEVSEDEK